MEKEQVAARAKKAQENWERLQESRKIKKIVDDGNHDTHDPSDSNAPGITKRDGKKKTQKGAFRDTA